MEKEIILSKIFNKNILKNTTDYYDKFFLEEAEYLHKYKTVQDKFFIEDCEIPRMVFNEHFFIVTIEGAVQLMKLISLKYKHV
ncbi:hypothetical protein Dip510_001875 [Elusimicrobium posterum]|uniref:hypothetical protein n=1 Tax=Elusimicrobium posterum TaxID=3116653 RepID=UPI003C74C5BB